MSFEVIKWAWDAEGIENPGEAFVLVALAQFANQDWSAWPSMATLMRLTRQSERTVRRHLRALEDGGYVTTTARHRAGGGQTSSTYRLTGARMSAAVVADLEEGVDVGVADVADGPPGGPPWPPTPGHIGPPRTSKKEVLSRSTTYPRQRGAWRPGETSDLAEAGVETLGASATTVIEIDRHRSRRSVSPDSVPGLVQHFAQRAGLVFRGFAVGNTNQGALAKHFSTWLREGISPWQIRTMIDVFMERAATYGPGKPPWKIFLGQKDALFDFIADRTDPDTVVATPEVYTWLKSQ